MSNMALLLRNQKFDRRKLDNTFSTLFVSNTIRVPRRQHLKKSIISTFPFLYIGSWTKSSTTVEWENRIHFMTLSLTCFDALWCFMKIRERRCTPRIIQRNVKAAYLCHKGSCGCWRRCFDDSRQVYNFYWKKRLIVSDIFFYEKHTSTATFMNARSLETNIIF